MHNFIPTYPITMSYSRKYAPLIIIYFEWIIWETHPFVGQGNIMRNKIIDIGMQSRPYLMTIHETPDHIFKHNFRQHPSTPLHLSEDHPKISTLFFTTFLDTAHPRVCTNYLSFPSLEWPQPCAFLPSSQEVLYWMHGHLSDPWKPIQTSSLSPVTHTVKHQPATVPF